MMRDPQGKLMTMALSDQAFRSHDPARINDQIMHLIHDYGVPAYFADWEQVALELGTRIGQYIPHLVVPFVVARLRAETSSVILPGEEDELRAYLQKRRGQQTRLNLNQLGEAILGEGEARRRLESYIELLARHDVEYISVKISSVFSQINLVAFDATVAHIKRGCAFSIAAMQHHFVQPDGSRTPKFINLDMEEYRDLHLTIAAFQQVLDEPEFQNYRAGIVLQAYLPDSHAAQMALTAWAKERGAAAPIKVRIVKGANLAMERVEAALHGWEQAPYHTKADVDANYKRMVLWGCQPQNAAAVHLGIASHNLLTWPLGWPCATPCRCSQTWNLKCWKAWPIIKRGRCRRRPAGCCSMRRWSSAMIFTAPLPIWCVGWMKTPRRKTFCTISLTCTWATPPGSAKSTSFWRRFSIASRLRPRPTARKTGRPSSATLPSRPPLPMSRTPILPCPPISNGPKVLWQRGATGSSTPSRCKLAANGCCPTKMGLAAPQPTRGGRALSFCPGPTKQIDRALNVAVAAQEGWRNYPMAERKALLLRVAETLAARRADLIGAAMLDGGKTIPQADTK
ncbi:MAG: proline dehydrogenase family protein [Caldilineaceae bacterium]